SQKMRVAKWNIVDRDCRRPNIGCGLRHLDIFVSQGRAADCLKNFVPYLQPVLDAQTVTDALKSPAFPPLCSLPIADVQGCGFGIARSQSRADTGIHASAQKHHGTRLATGQKKLLLGIYVLSDDLHCRIAALKRRNFGHNYYRKNGLREKIA